MAEHTPGPWQADKRKIDGEWVATVEAPTCVTGTRIICEVGLITGDRTEEDTRLIAAAPDLVAACEALMRWYHDPHALAITDVVALAEDAIAKARAT